LANLVLEGLEEEAGWQASLLLLVQACSDPLAKPESLLARLPRKKRRTTVAMKKNLLKLVETLKNVM